MPRALGGEDVVPVDATADAAARMQTVVAAMKER